MPDGFHETPVRGKHLHNAGAPAETAVSTLPAVATNLDPTLSEGNLVHLSTDLAGNLRVVISDTENAGGTLVDVADRQARILGMVRTDADTRAFETGEFTTTRTLLSTEFDDLRTNDTAEFTATRTLLATEFDDLRTNDTAEFTATRTLLTTEFADTRTNDTAEATATRAAIVDLRDVLSSNLEQITPQVRGADVSDTNPLPVNLQTNPGTLVDSGLLSSVDLAPGASVTLSSAAVGAGLAGHLVEMTAAASVRIKVVLAAGATAVRVFFVDPTSDSLVYVPVDRDSVTAAAAETFSVTITNMDNLRTADVYASTTHVEF